MKTRRTFHKQKPRASFSIGRVRCLTIATVLAMLSANLACAQFLNGTYNVSESWTVTLEYRDWADSGFTGTKTFSGTHTGTIIVNNGSYALIDKIGLPWTAPGSPFTNRTIRLSGGYYSISSSTYSFAPAFGAQAYGLVFLGCFAVRVPLIDGEIPAFHSYDYYSADGDNLAEISGSGNMIGSSLRAYVSSNSKWVRVVGKPVITQQPQSQTLTAGQNVTLQVIAAGDPPLKYFWRKGTTVLTGKTNSMLVLTNLQPADAGGYSVIVSNAGGTVTSQTAQLTVTPLPPPWFEGWEKPAVGIRFPSTNLDTAISGDKGVWALGDTVATTYPDCGLPVSHADVLIEDGRKLLKLTSVDSGTLCSDNISVSIIDPINASLPYPLLPNTQISFFEKGFMASPEWNGLFGCIFPPCGDAVGLRVTDNLLNQVVYVFQRAPNYVPHTNTGYVEIFLDTAGGEFSRNLRDDFARISGAAHVGNHIIGVEFGISDEGWAALDDLRIGSPYLTSSDTTKPTVSITSPANLAQLAGSTVTVLGTTSDNVGIAFVEYRLENANGISPYQHANGTTAWSANIVGLTPGPNTIRVRTQDVSGNLSAEATRVLTYVLSAPFTVQTNGSGVVTPNLNGKLLEIGKSYTMTATAAPGSAFSNWTGSISTNRAALTFVMQSNLTFTANFVDVQKPTIVVTNPPANARLSNAVATFRGTARDNLALDRVVYQLNGGPFQNATGTSNWSATVNLVAGTNTLTVKSIDPTGNESLVASRKVSFVVPSPLTLITNGSGSVAGVTNGQMLEVGRGYKLTAKAALRNLFVNWTGDLASTNPALTFLMQSNMTLQANFVTNPFVGLKGTYYGLFSETNAVRNHDRSGNFTLTLAEAGTYSASFQLGAKKLPATGKFDWLGESLLKLKPSISSTVVVTLRLDVTNLSAWVEGAVSDTSWRSPLLGYRAPTYAGTNASPRAGKHTLVIPGSENAATSPGGDGYGTVTIGKTGSLTLAGKLADGTLLSQSIPVSADAWWALYSSLYTTKGGIQGWMMFTNEAGSDIGGELSWIKPALAASKFYPLGFTNKHDAVGSLYFPPTTHRVINITNSLMEFRHGNLVQPITNIVVLTTNNRITNLSSNKLAMTLTLTSGQFAGSVTDTNTGKAIPFTGVLLQKLDSGFGYFLGTNQSGQVRLIREP